MFTVFTNHTRLTFGSGCARFSHLSCLSCLSGGACFSGGAFCSVGSGCALFSRGTVLSVLTVNRVYNKGRRLPAAGRSCIILGDSNIGYFIYADISKGKDLGIQSCLFILDTISHGHQGKIKLCAIGIYNLASVGQELPRGLPVGQIGRQPVAVQIPELQKTGVDFNGILIFKLYGELRRCQQIMLISCFQEEILKLQLRVIIGYYIGSF